MSSVTLACVLVAVVLSIDGATSCNINRMQISDVNNALISVLCPPGWAAVACDCTGACERLIHSSTRKCRARKTVGSRATIVATCVQDTVSQYYIGNPGGACNSGDSIISCFLVNGNAADYNVPHEVANGICAITGPCIGSCIVKALCKM